MANPFSPLAAAKQRVTIWDVADVNGWPLVRRKKNQIAFWRCEKTPSLSIRRDGLKWYDHGTGTGGDQINLISAVKGVSNGEACRELMAIAHGSEVCLKRAKIRPCVEKLPRSNLPILSKPSDEMVAQIARLRSLPTSNGIREAVRRGHFWSAIFNDFPERDVSIWVLTDSAKCNAQARRCDGKPWNLKGSPKSKTIRPSRLDVCWPIGCADLGETVMVMMVEGEGDFLAALELGSMALGQEIEKVGVCFVSGIAKKVSEQALPAFKGRHVRVIPQIDRDSRKGEWAALGWGNALERAGAFCDYFHLRGVTDAAGAPIKDLGDLWSDMGNGTMDRVQIECIASHMFERQTSNWEACLGRVRSAEEFAAEVLS